MLCVAVSGVMSASTGASASAGTWRVQAVPQPNRAELDGVSCPTEQDCTAVGELGPAEQWNGSTWTEQTLPGYPFTAVSCAAADSCVAVGSFAETAIWDGTSWTSEQAPTPTGSSSELDAVSCASTTNCSATGFWTGSGSNQAQALAEHWDGTSWTREKVALPAGADSADLSAGLSCPTANRCIAIGVDQLTAGGGGPIMARWNGTRWTAQAITLPADAELRGLSCPRPAKCTAVGGTVDDTTGTINPLVEYWNGSTWAVQADAAPAGSILNAVSCPNAKSCTAVGQSAGQVTGVAEYWDGTSWTAQDTPNPFGHTNSVDLLAVSCESDFHCTAVGDYGGYGHPLAEREN
jgi:hypothetical protein